jgi:ABC-type antimicrobial peptide transport system permease subunit
MLMSVTERFKEIATMKCLGATDGFIMIHFMLESSLLGTAGGILGAVLGLVLGILSASSVYGTLALKNLSLLSLLGSGLASIVCGLLISIISAVYPARVAARLAPMEAMRVE